MKKKTVCLIFTILFMVIIVGSASYAYFLSSFQIESDLEFEAIFSSVKPVFTAQVEKDVDLQVRTTDMISQSVGTSKSDDGTIKVELLSGNDNVPATCWYDIEYVWESAPYSPTHTLPVIDEENNITYNYELSLKGTRSTTDDDSFTYSNKNLNEINIDKLNWIEGEKLSAKLVDDAEIHNQSSTTPSVTTWTFTMSFYSLPTSQNNLLNQSYKGHLVITDARC